MRSTTKCVIAALACLVAVGSAAACGSNSTGPGNEGGGGDGAVAFNLSDQRRVAGFADIVFVGKIDSTAGTKSAGPIPGKQFNATVVEYLKGDAGKNILINQGESSSDDVGDVTPLVVGQTYLLAARFSTPNGWYTVVPGSAGTIPLTPQDAAAAARSVGTDLSDPSAIVRMRQSIASEIPYQDPRPRPARSSLPPTTSSPDAVAPSTSQPSLESPPSS